MCKYPETGIVKTIVNKLGVIILSYCKSSFIVSNQDYGIDRGLDT